MLKISEIASPLRAALFGLLNHAVIKVNVISVANSLSVLAIQSPPFQANWERGQIKQGGTAMGGIQISGSGTIVPNEYIKPCIDEIFQVFKKHFPEEMQTTEIITVILDLAKEQVRYKQIIL